MSILNTQNPGENCKAVRKPGLHYHATIKCSDNLEGYALEVGVTHRARVRKNVTNVIDTRQVHHQTLKT